MFENFLKLSIENYTIIFDSDFEYILNDEIIDKFVKNNFIASY